MKVKVKEEILHVREVAAKEIKVNEKPVDTRPKAREGVKRLLTISSTALFTIGTLMCAYNPEHPS